MFSCADDALAAVLFAVLPVAAPESNAVLFAVLPLAAPESNAVLLAVLPDEAPELVDVCDRLCEWLLLVSVEPARHVASDTFVEFDPLAVPFTA